MGGPPKGSIPGRKPPKGLVNVLGGGTSNLLGGLLGGVEELLSGTLKGLGKTIESVQNLNLEDLEKLAEAQGNEEAKEKLKTLKEAMGKEGIDLSNLVKGARPKSAPKTEKPMSEKIEVQEPEMEVYQEEKQIRVIGEMPGAEEENITCEVEEEGTVLSVSAEGRKRYTKKVELPLPVTKKVNWSYRNGVLEVILTKRKAS